MKEVVAKAGERTRVLYIISDSIPQEVRFAARPAAHGGPLAGTVEVIRRPWFLTTVRDLHPLLAEQSFRKGFADTSYAIYVTPVEDSVVAFRTRHFDSQALFWILGAVLLLGVLSAVFALVLTPSGAPAP